MWGGIFGTKCGGRGEGRTPGRRQSSLRIKSVLHALLLIAATTFQGVVVTPRPSGADEPVPAALVELWEEGPPRTAVSATDGTFWFPDVAPGPHSIRISSGHAAARGWINIPAAPASRPRRFILFAPGCWGVYGAVTDRFSAAAIPGASVHYLGVAITNVDGEYVIDWGCPVGPGFPFHNSFFYGASAGGYQPVSVFGGRAELVAGVLIQDFLLVPLDRRADRPPPEPDRMR